MDFVSVPGPSVLQSSISSFTNTFSFSQTNTLNATQHYERQGISHIQCSSNINQPSSPSLYSLPTYLHSPLSLHYQSSFLSISARSLIMEEASTSPPTPPPSPPNTSNISHPAPFSPFPFPPLYVAYSLPFTNTTPPPSATVPSPPPPPPLSPCDELTTPPEPLFHRTPSLLSLL